MPVKTSAATGNWSVAGTWSPSGAPATDDDVLISGHTVTIDTAAVARTVEITQGGRLRASRSITNTLTVGSSTSNVFGISVHGAQASPGILDYGTFSDRIPASVIATIRIRVAAETAMNGGRSEIHPTAPDSTAPGIWVWEYGEIHAHGAIKDTWTPLAATAAAGATSASVNTNWMVGWGPGDEIVFTPTHMPTAPDGVQQDEVRTLTDVAGGTVSWSVPLVNAHSRTTVAWTDRHGDAWTEVLAGKVANLTKNVVFRADNPAQRPHMMNFGNSRFFIEDVAFRDYAPDLQNLVGTKIGRYAIHPHMQTNASRGSYARRCIFRDTPGESIHIHQAYGVILEENVFYRVATGLASNHFTPDGTTANAHAIPIVLEPVGLAGSGVFDAANDAVIDKSLFCMFGRGLVGRDANEFPMGIWLGGSANCLISGTVGCGAADAFGSDRSGGPLAWPEGGIAVAGPTPRTLKTEGFCNGVTGFGAHINLTISETNVDILSWNNFSGGMRVGAYDTNLWFFKVRLIGNGSTNFHGNGDTAPLFTNQAIRTGVTDFFIDGLNRTGALAYRVTEYILNSPASQDSVLEDGVIRNVPGGIFRHMGYTIYNAASPIRDIVRAEGEGSGLTHTQLAQISFPGTDILYGGMSDPSTHRQPSTATGADNQSRLRIRSQTGITGYPANFTLYMRDDPNITTFVDDATMRAKRVDNDTDGARATIPRCFLSSPADDSQAPAPDASGRRLVTLTCLTDATGTCVFWQGLAAVGSVPIVAGSASITFDMSTHPHRNAYFWAHVGGPLSGVGTAGGINTSRVHRVWKPLGAVQVPDPTAPTLNSFTSSAPTTVSWAWTDVQNEIRYDCQTSPNGSTGWTTRVSVGPNITSASWTGATPNTTYHGRVVAVGNSGNLFNSNVIGPITTAFTVPASPINVNFTNVTQTTLDLRFTDNSGGGDDDETNFHHRRRTPPTSGTYGTTTNVASTTQASTGTVYTQGVTGLTAGAAYEFEVWASNASGESARVTATVTMLAAAPAAPTNLATGAPTTSSVPLTWTDNATNETAYEVQFKRSIDATWLISSSTLPAGTTSHTVTGLAIGTSYDFRVRCRAGGIQSAFSNVVTISTAGPPTAPTSLATGAPATTSMPLTWVDNATDETAYEVQFKRTVDVPWTVDSSTLAANTVSRTVSGLTAGTSYDFRVRCSRDGINSAFSNIVTGTTANPPPPIAPSGLATGVVTETSVALSWIDNATNETSYETQFRRGDEVPPVTNLSSSGITITASNIIDYNPATLAWDIAGATVNSWVMFDLGSAKTITRAALYLESAGSTAIYNVQFADDPQGVWTQAYGGFAPTNAGWNEAQGFEGTPGARRYWRFLLATAGTGRVMDAAFGYIWGVDSAALAANSTSRTVSALSPNTAYQFRVRCANASGNSAFSNEATGTTLAPPAPAAPSNLAAGVPTTTTIPVTWTDNATTETGYTVYHTQVEEFISGIGGTVTLNGITSVPPNGWDVSGAAVGSSVVVDLGTGKTLTRAAILAAAAGGTATYDVQWADATAGPWTTVSTNFGPTALGWQEVPWNLAGSHRYWRFRVSAAGTGQVSDQAWGYRWADSGTLAANTVSHTITGLTAATSYKIVVRAIRDTVQSATSNQIVATTANPPLPNAPTSLTATTPTTSSMLLSWIDNATDETAYEVEYKLNSVTPWTVATTTLNPNTTSFVVTGLTANTLYDFRVRCRSANGASGYSNTATAATTANTPPLAPSSLAAGTVTQTTVPLTWLDSATDETAYEVEYRIQGNPTWTVATTALAANSTSYTVTGLTAGISYEFRVRCRNANGPSAYSNTATATTTPPPAPSAPTALAAGTTTQTTVPLTWTDNATDETAYHVEFRVLGIPTWTVDSNTLPANTISRTVSGLTANTQYEFRVRCERSGTMSAYSLVVSATTQAPQPPLAPSGLAPGVLTTSSVALSWIDNATDETSYETQFRLSPAGAWTVDSATLPANTTSRTVSGLTANTAYDFRVRCASGVGQSAFSSVVTATTLAVSPPATPSGLATGAVTNTSVALAWTDNATTETAYHVEYRILGAPAWTVDSSTLPANTISRTVSGLANGTTYEFRVRCETTGTLSAYSNVVSAATTNPAPGTPTLSSATATGPNTISATWTNVTDESGFDIETSPTGAGTWTIRRSFSADTITGTWDAASPDTAYDVRVVAFNGATRVASGVINVTTPRALPAGPSIPGFANLTSTSLDFSVQDNSGAAGDAETGFNARYRDETEPANPGNWTSLPTNPALTGTGLRTTWTVSGLSGGRTYKLEAWATNATGDSITHLAATATTPPDQPVSLPGARGQRPRAGRIGSALGKVLGRARYWASIDPKG